MLMQSIGALETHGRARTEGTEASEAASRNSYKPLEPRQGEPRQLNKAYQGL